MMKGRSCPTGWPSTTDEAARRDHPRYHGPKSVASLRPLDDALPRGPRRPALGSRPEIGFLVAAATLHAGDLDRARTLSRQGGLLEPAPRWWNWEALTCFQAELAAELGDLDAAARLVDDLTPVAHHLAVYGSIAALGPVTRYLGRLEAALGRWADAEAHLKDCLDVSAAQGLHPSWAAAAVSLAEVLVDTGRAAAAVDLLTEALRVADELGLSRTRARVLALDSRTPGRLTDRLAHQGLHPPTST